MSNYYSLSRKSLSKMEQGQVLVVVAASLVVILAVMGLALDVGVMFIGNARMRRAVDAAALAAALQYKPGVQFSDLDSSAVEFLGLNGIQDPQALVQVCDTTEPPPPDSAHTIPASLNVCPTTGQMQRKLVRVVASGRVPLAFLPVIGINSVPIVANAVSETASIDVVLVIDRSESMTYSAAPLTQDRDPMFCNANDAGVPPTGPHDPWDASYQGNCEPFHDVKYAAISFVNSLYFPYDRVSVVTFDKNSTRILEFTNDKNLIINTIKGLTVFEGDESVSGPMTGLPGINAVYPNGNPSRKYIPPPPPYPPTGVYRGLLCPDQSIPTSPNYPSPADCTTTNIGLGMAQAGLAFNVAPIRTNSLWVVILLTDGIANAGYSDTHQFYCPDATWLNADTYSGTTLQTVLPKCNDGLSSTRHTPDTSAAYDAEDYAMDMTDFVALTQNALIFSIGLGAQVTAPSTLDGTPLGELFLKYAADTGLGLYYDAPDSTQLEDVFQKIADNIATRLEH